MLWKALMIKGAMGEKGLSGGILSFFMVFVFFPPRILSVL
jgi:hypothetical protein